MSYSANQYNHATPLSSVSGFTNASSVVDDVRYFTLFDNTLDGSYHPISSDVGLWGTSLSDASGVLSEPFVVTITDNYELNAIRIISSKENYPVAFTIQLYDSVGLTHTITEAANTAYEYVHYLPRMFPVTSIVLTITKISQANSVAKLYNVYNPAYIKRSVSMPIRLNVNSSTGDIQRVSSSDILSVAGKDAIGSFDRMMDDAAVVRIIERSNVRATVRVADTLSVKHLSSLQVNNRIAVSDTLRLRHATKSHIRNTIGVTRDTLAIKTTSRQSHVRNSFTVLDRLLTTFGEISDVANVHSAMKAPTRRIYGKVYVTYSDPALDKAPEVHVSTEAYNSVSSQVVDGLVDNSRLLFTLYDNDLSGRYHVSTANDQVGWTSGEVSNADGKFSSPQYLFITFAPRPIVELKINFDNTHGSVAEDFLVEFISSDQSMSSYTVAGNKQASVDIALSSPVPDVIAIRVSVTKVNKPYHPVVILDVPSLSTFLYTGYADNSDLVSIDVLEELTYEDDIEALGGVSANECTIVFDNHNKHFNVTNANSPIAKQLKRNRKIVPWLGVEVVKGTIEWYQMGVYWSYNWDVPYNSLTASVVGFDTIGLLDTTTFYRHQLLTNASLGYLIEYILSDAKSNLDFIEWYIAPELYDVIIPYAWFESGSHSAALRKVSACYPMHIYCDRTGRICAMPQKLHLDYYYDTWSDSTNVIDKTYSSLYTDLPNVINVEVVEPALVAEDILVDDELVFDVVTVPSRTLNFSRPYASDISIVIDKDSTVKYTYEVYSWGIQFNFTGTGSVRSIYCIGTALDTSRTSVLTRRDQESIMLNGEVTRNISADFIQSSSHASILMQRLLELSTNDKFDAEINYRGDISLTINDPILLLDGLSPDSRYNIKRHKLFWNGALSGTAFLNT